MARKGIYPESVTPGIPKLGKKPTGWREVYFKDVLKVVERKAVLQDDKKLYACQCKKKQRRYSFSGSTSRKKDPDQNSIFY